jgi:hypothetical protein
MEYSHLYHPMVVYHHQNQDVAILVGHPILTVQTMHILYPSFILYIVTVNITLTNSNQIITKVPFRNLSKSETPIFIFYIFRYSSRVDVLKILNILKRAVISMS